MFFAIINLMMFSSCKENEGCTDRFALNWDVDADSDDGTCIYESTRFLGDYDAVQDCEETPTSNYQLTISIDPNPTSANPEFMTEVILDSDQLPMIKGMIVANPSFIMFDQDVNIPGIGDVSIYGEARLSDDNVLTIDITRNYMDSMNNIVVEDCTVTATKN